MLYVDQNICFKIIIAILIKNINFIKILVRSEPPQNPRLSMYEQPYSELTHELNNFIAFGTSLYVLRKKYTSLWNT